MLPQSTITLSSSCPSLNQFIPFYSLPGKFVLLSKLLPKLYDGGHKVLIFSQMVRVLDLLQELLQLKHYRYERLDGSTSASARNAAVDRFRRESYQRFVMLLSTRAGGEIIPSAFFIYVICPRSHSVLFHYMQVLG